MKNRTDLDNLTYAIIGAAIEVHKSLGPGLLESAYHCCMEEELRQLKINFKSELSVPIKYKNIYLEAQLRCDLFVEDILVVELKSVAAFVPVFDAQVISYMKLLQAPKGLLINFNCTHIFKEGQKTFVNDLYRNLNP